METIRRNRKSTIIAFLLSLLFHASFILYIALQKTDFFSPLPIPPQEEEKELQHQMQKNEPWVETKARAGNFGAPVFFKDTLNEPSSFAKASEDKQQPEPEIPQENTSQEEQEQPEASPLHHEDAIETVKEEEMPITMQQPQRIQQPREREKEKQLTSRQPPRTTPPAQPSPKKLPSLAQLTQGFLHHMKDEGKYAVHMLGKKNGVPTDEQMKYERYLQKLNWCLQNSFNINHDRCPPSEGMEATVQIFLALNKDGTVKHLNLVKSSGNRLLDQFVLFVFRDTSSSFPPVPHYLPHDPFAITYTVMLNSMENNFSIYKRS